MTADDTIDDDQPHWVTEDNMGMGEHGYWRQFRTTSDGNCVIGKGVTKQQAIDDAEKAYQLKEEYLAKSDPERLEILLAKPELLSKELNEAIQILGKFALVQMKEKLYGTS